MERVRPFGWESRVHASVNKVVGKGWREGTSMRAARFCVISSGAAVARARAQVMCNVISKHVRSRRFTFVQTAVAVLQLVERVALIVCILFLLLQPLPRLIQLFRLSGTG